MKNILQLKFNHDDYFDWNLDSLEISNRFAASSFCVQEILSNNGSSFSASHEFSLEQVAKNVWLDNGFWQELLAHPEASVLSNALTRISDFLNREQNLTLQKEIFENTQLIDLIKNALNTSPLHSLNTLYKFNVFTRSLNALYKPVSSINLIYAEKDRQTYEQLHSFDISASSIPETTMSSVGVEKVKNYILNSENNDLYFLNSTKLNNKWFAPNLSTAQSIDLILKDIAGLEEILYKVSSHPLPSRSVASLDYMLHALPQDKRQDIDFLFKLSTAILGQDSLNRSFTVSHSQWIMYLAYKAPEFIDFFKHITSFFETAKSKPQQDKAHLIAIYLYDVYACLSYSSNAEKVHKNLIDNKDVFLSRLPSVIKFFNAHQLNSHSPIFNDLMNSMLLGEKEVVNTLTKNNISFASYLNLKNLKQIESEDLKVEIINKRNSSSLPPTPIPPEWMTLEIWLKVTDFNYFRTNASNKDFKEFHKETGFLKDPQFISHLIDCDAVSMIYYAMNNFSSLTKNKDLVYKMACQLDHLPMEIHETLLKDNDFLLKMIAAKGEKVMNLIPAPKWQEDSWVKLMLGLIKQEKLSPALYLPPFLITMLEVKAPNGSTNLLSKYDILVEKKKLLLDLNTSSDGLLVEKSVKKEI